jgi:anti-anti-sigma factor
MNARRPADVQALLDQARALREASRQTREHAAAARASPDPQSSLASAEHTHPRFGLAGRGEGYVVVEAVGAVDVASQHALRGVLTVAVENGVPTVIVDLSAVTLLSAAAIHCLDRLATLLSRRGGGLHVVCGPDGMTARVSRISDPDCRWPRHPDVATAVAAVTSHS